MSIKPILENWRKFESEQKARLVFENIISEREQTLNNLEEAKIDISSQGVSIEFGKWLAMAGIATQASAAAVTIAAMNAPWYVFAATVLPGVLPVAGIAGLISLRFKPVRSFLAYLFKKLIGKKFIEKISNSFQSLKGKITKQTDLDEKETDQIFGKISEIVLNNHEFKERLGQFRQAVKTGDEEQMKILSDSLDDLAKDIINKEILDQDSDIDTDEFELRHAGVTATGTDGRTMYAKDNK